MNAEDNQITLVLQRITAGDRAAEAEFLRLMYSELHRLAERQFRSERAGHTLEPSALVNELYLRLIHNTTVQWRSRAHFYAVAALTVRRILVDYARATHAKRRPDPSRRVDLDVVAVYSDDHAHEVLLVDEALNRLAEWDPRQARIVELLFFAGLTVEETAHVLGISARTVKRDWTMARAWLSALLNGRSLDSPPADETSWTNSAGGE